MIHPSHELKAYTGDVNKRTEFCIFCGKEVEEGLGEPCTKKFYVKDVDKDKEQK